jgi:3-methyladenine DNA glycosylase AlkC
LSASRTEHELVVHLIAARRASYVRSAAGYADRVAEPFKNLINDGTVRAIATQLARVAPEFPAQRFAALALPALQSLELKARAMQLCEALQATLPAQFPIAADWIEAALAPPADAAAPDGDDSGGLRGWSLWAAGEFVARQGIHHPERALQALHAITQRFTAEWALRPFVERHPDLTFATLTRWLDDPSEHVRRLVSEGTRPRLPWGLQLKALIADPSPALPLLRVLQDDASDYVRRSVANHLNDIAKDHPELVAQWVHEHLSGASPERRALLRHASRTLIKRGHAPTLQAWRLGKPLRGDVVLNLSPRRAKAGGALQLKVVLTSGARSVQRLAIDYVLHRVVANGSLAPKVFKGWTIELAAGEQRTLLKRHSLREVTTRRLYPGRHEIELQVNGRSVARATFQVSVP